PNSPEPTWGSGTYARNISTVGSYHPGGVNGGAGFKAEIDRIGPVSNGRASAVPISCRSQKLWSLEDSTV
ncbi:hypothetical protein AB1L30_00475, partial [Bremerella sp. JC817]|uniref:hypothetical protein n=1 Tax=Bremerella sp. JC817 TaxID=3231756 RepID=UPI0034595DE5